MDDFTIKQRVKTILDDYKSLFGSSAHLDLSQDITIAERQLQVWKYSIIFAVGSHLAK